MINKPSKNKMRHKRHLRIRKKISGNTIRPRLNVYRSNRYIYAQLIDDTTGFTLATASSKGMQGLESRINKEAAARVGQAIGQKAVELGFKNIVFDRSGYLYHGRVKELADAAREAGLEF
ncbi:MAG: 50S ribosomal protein L18 [Eubacteriaceae bacterium]|nr:50S ribosomal protein L18 [Eubacteriaceae bacterium]